MHLIYLHSIPKNGKTTLSGTNCIITEWKASDVEADIFSGFTQDFCGNPVGWESFHY